MRLFVTPVADVGRPACLTLVELLNKSTSGLYLVLRKRIIIQFQIKAIIDHYPCNKANKYM